MNNSRIADQVVVLFEKYPTDITVEEIASEMNLNVDYVRAVLMTRSSIFRDVQKSKEAKKEYISAEELHEFYDNYKALARYTESDIVKEKCLAKLIDDARGRLDKKPVEETAPVNINVIQVMLNRAKANKEIALVGEIKELEVA